MTVSGSERKLFNVLNMDMFLKKKRTTSHYRRHILPPKPCEARFIMDVCALFHYFQTVEKKKTPAYCHSNAWKSKDNFLYFSNWIHLKKVIYTQDSLKVSTIWANFHFWVNLPFKLLESYGLLSHRLNFSKEWKFWWNWLLAAYQKSLRFH